MPREEGGLYPFCRQALCTDTPYFSFNCVCVCVCGWMGGVSCNALVRIPRACSARHEHGGDHALLHVADSYS
jgi:hypothetical protein